jgi:hypothetical protein
MGISIQGRSERDAQDLDGAVPGEDALGVEAVEDGEVHLRVGPGADWNWWLVGWERCVRVWWVL